MAVAVTERFNVPHGKWLTKKTKAGWIGSKAGTKGDIVTIDANGHIDQAVAAEGPLVAGTKIAVLNDNVESTVAVDTADAQKVSIMVPKDDNSILEMQCCGAAGAAVATTDAMVGDNYEIYRHANGNYVVDTSETTDTKVTVVGISPRYPLGTVGGTLLVRFMDTMKAL